MQNIFLKKKRLSKKYSKFKEESFYKKPKHKKYSNKKYQNTSKKVDKEDVECFKCGKKGHTTPNCKIKEIIADLDIGKRLKQQMINLIKTKSLSDSSSQTSVESSSDDQLLLIEDSSSKESNKSSSQSSCDCENCLYHIKQVNVITSEQNFLMELIDKLPNQNVQREYF